MTAPVADRRGTSSAPDARELWRRGRGPLAVLGGLLLAALLVAALASPGSGRDLDPPLVRPRRLAGRRRAARGGRRAGPRRRRPAAAARGAGRREHRRRAGARRPDRGRAGGARRPRAPTSSWWARRPASLAALDLPVQASPVGVAVRRPACLLPAADRAGPARAGGVAYTAAPGTGAVGCYATDGSPTLLALPGAAHRPARRRRGADQRRARRAGRRRARRRPARRGRRGAVAAAARRPRAAGRPAVAARPGARRGAARRPAAGGRRRRPRAVARPRARARGGGAAAGRRARRGDRRGPQPALPGRRRPRLGRAGAARAAPATGSSPGSGCRPPPSRARSSPPSRRGPGGARPTSRRSCTVRLPATTPRWCAWPTTWTASCRRSRDGRRRASADPPRGARRPRDAGG